MFKNERIIRQKYVTNFAIFKRVTVIASDDCSSPKTLYLGMQILFSIGVRLAS